MIELMEKTLNTLMNLEKRTSKSPILIEKNSNVLELLNNHNEVYDLMISPLEKLENLRPSSLDEIKIYLFRLHQRFIYEYYILEMKDLINKKIELYNGEECKQ